MPGLPNFGALAFLDKYIVGYALGTAAGPALYPFVQDLETQAYALAQFAPLPIETAAEIAAENFAQLGAMETEATLTGYNKTRFDLLYDVTLTGPGMGTVLRLAQRQSEQKVDVNFALRKAKLDPQFDAAVLNLANERLSVADLAYMIVRGVLPDKGTLPSPLPTKPDQLKLPQQLSLDPVVEASLSGWDKTRLQAMVDRSGLAMGPVQAAQAYYRGILTLNDYYLTIARGDLYPAFADPVLQVSAQIPTVGEMMEHALRGYDTFANAQKNAARHGMSLADSQLVYEDMGRAINPHQVTIGLARGGKYDGNPTTAPSPWLEALQRGNVRPEWYDLAFHAEQYTFPSAFVFRQLLRDGAITQAQGQQYFLEIGWPPSLAQAVSQAYGTTTATADPHVGKAQTQLWGTTHKSYVAGEIDDPTATTALSAAGVGAAAVPAVLSLWDEERSLIRKQLSPAQVKKAYSEGVQNPATGAPWSLADATAALLARGYDQADATTLLEE